VGDLVSYKLGRRRGMRRAISALAWYELGCALEATDPSEAQIAYRRAIAGRPDLADAHNNLGRLLHDAGELAAAEAAYRRALAAIAAAPLDALVGGEALYWFNLGVVLEDQGRSAEAIAAYERAVTIDDALADAHFNLARQIELAARACGDELMLRRAFRHLKAYRALARASGS
jgi:Tfp pilus assembly protein PilF